MGLMQAKISLVKGMLSDLKATELFLKKVARVCSAAFPVNAEYSSDSISREKSWIFLILEFLLMKFVQTPRCFSVPYSPVDPSFT